MGMEESEGSKRLEKMMGSQRWGSGTLSKRWTDEFASMSDGGVSRTSSMRISVSDFNDEAALKWAALEKLPTYDRLRTAIIKNMTAEDHGKTTVDEIDVTKLDFQIRQQILDNVLAEADNSEMLAQLRHRLDAAGIELPKVEVRFEDVDISASVHVGSRAVSSISNALLNACQTFLGILHLIPSRKRSIRILQNVSGIVRPSRLTLLLGPPRSGKTSLLLAIGNKLDSKLKVKGQITYNGHTFKEFVPQKTSAYINQNDLHMWELTVRETLNFSARCQGVGSGYDLLAELLRREVNAGIKPDPELDAFMKATVVEGQEASIWTDYVLRILGLDICADTLVGSHLKRGISGGQKKRLTTGEMLVGPAKVLLMDDISSGLDSSTTFHVVKCLKQAVEALDETVMISLLQPAPETFELFDDLILLTEGHIIYQGPRQMVLQFFESQGFKCPDRKSVADFLQEVTSEKDQAKYWIRERNQYRYILPKELADAFKNSSLGLVLSEDLSKPFVKSRSHPAALVQEKFTLSNWELLKACMGRESILMKRNSFLYIFKCVQITFVALVVSSVFFRTTMHTRNISDGTKYMGALYFGLMNVMINAVIEMKLAVVRLPVFYKQRDLLFYPSWAWALSVIIFRIPVSLIESSAWTCVTYWIIGFAPEITRFFKQILLLFLMNQSSSGFFRVIASLGRESTIATMLSFFMLVVLIVLGGFVISRDNIHSWWLWGYWGFPLSYGMNAISVNEFLAERWQKPLNNRTSETIGIALLKARGIFTDAKWYWIGIAAQAGFIILFNSIYILCLSLLNPLETRQKNFKDDEKRELEQQGSMESIDSETAGVAPKKGMVLAFEPLTMTFDHVTYSVDLPPEMKQDDDMPDKLELLRDISGAFRPGILTALIGVSGAGKTTLMDVLAGRKTGGYIEGNITISGYPKNQDTFARVSGYCEQNDIHSPLLTVKESLIFSAWARLPKDIKLNRRMMFVEEVMELVELTPLKDASVGLAGESGLSTEQRKRLTIAVELVANPSIMFMDEPTSGLDARAAAIVMRAVRNTVDTGRTVVCTIHQPSIDIFESFDELLLMKRGGQLIYAGPLGLYSTQLIQYFEGVEGVKKISEGYNPATWALEVTSQSVEHQLDVDFAAIYQTSSLYKRNEELIQNLNVATEGSSDLYFPTKYSLSYSEQFVACLWKQHHSYWGDPSTFYFRMLYALGLGGVFGTIFWNAGNRRETEQDIRNVIGCMYASVLFLGISNSATIQPRVAVERVSYYRERAAGMYSSLPYAIAQVCIEVPYIFVQALIYGSVVYFMMNLERTLVKFASFLYFMFFTYLAFTFFGMMAIGFTPNEQISAVFASLFYSLWNLFAGFVIPRQRIPVWWRWFYWCSPASWAINGLISSQLGDVERKVILSDGVSSISVKELLNVLFGFKYELIGVIAIVVLIFPLVFAFGFAFSLKHFNFQMR